MVVSWRSTWLVCVSFLLGSLVARAETRTEVVSEERALSDSYSQLHRDGFDSFALIQRLNTAANALSPEDRQALVGFKTGAALPPALAERLAPTLRELSNVESRLASFQSSYDRFNNRKMDYYIERYEAMLAQAYPQLRERVKPSDAAELDAIRARMATRRDDYNKFPKELNGSPRDRKRMVEYIMYFIEMDNLIQRANYAAMSPGERASLQSKKMFDKVFGIGRMALSAPSFAKALFSKYGIIDAAGAHIAGKARGNGLRVEPRGLENKPASTNDPNRINVYVPLHAHLELDVPSFAGLKLKNYNIFVSATLPDFLRGIMGIPGPIVDRLEQNRQILWVEKAGKNPIKELRDRIDKEGVRDIIATAEANLPARIMQSVTRPLQENFGAGTIELLRRSGKEVTIVPVTMSGNFRLGEDYLTTQVPGFDGNVLPVTVHKPISAAAVDLIAASGNKLLLNHLVRQQWLDQMHRDFGGRRLMGMPSLDEHEPALDRRLLSPKGCRFWSRLGVSVPVADGKIQ